MLFIAYAMLFYEINTKMSQNIKPHFSSTKMRLFYAIPCYICICKRLTI